MGHHTFRHRRGSSDAAGTTSRARPDPDRWQAIGPVSEDISRCRDVLARPLTRTGRAFVISLLQTAEKRPLTDAQRARLAELASIAGAELAPAAEVAQPWGPLPKTPPGRRTS